jgi:ribosomal protein S18 acetylase RimI-like enzyme
MFLVNPALQANGIGKHMLAEVEKLTHEMWIVDKFQMQVITLRYELIEFYERCGYLLIGIFSEFPVNPTVWLPKLANLQLATLEKLALIKHQTHLRA